MADIRQTHALAINMLDQHGLSGWKIRWNRMVGEAGRCSYRDRTIYLSATAVTAFTDAQVLELLKHEIGHALIAPGHGHDKVWRKMVRSIGGTPEEKSPEFSPFLARIATPENGLFLALILVGAWLTMPPVAIGLGVVVAGYLVVGLIRDARPVLTDEEIYQIEKDTRS